MNRSRLEQALAEAHRRAAELSPFSPSWDAAMGEVEDLERALLWLERSGSMTDEQPCAVAGTREAIGA